MKLKFMVTLAHVSLFLLLLNCAASKKTVLESPQSGKSLLVGAILVENVGLEDVYEAKTANITVVIVGRFEENGKDETKGYRVKTNSDGYFMVQVDLGYETHMIVSSRWEGNVQHYYPENLMIDNTVRAWPPVSNQQVIDLQIRYFRIDAANRIVYDTFKSLDNAQLSLPDNQYTMPNPETYFRNKYPDWGWFK
jgi:hypothetical protein